MRIDIRAMALSAAVGALGTIAAAALAAPALAQPLIPVPPPPPPPPAQMQAAGDPAAPAAAPAEVPHLASPENLPPGTVDDPSGPTQPRLTYLRELWHAMQTQEVSGSDALLLLTQRGMDANSAPPPGMPAGPQAPLPPAPAPVPPPAPVP